MSVTVGNVQTLRAEYFKIENLGRKYCFSIEAVLGYIMQVSQTKL